MRYLILLLLFVSCVKTENAIKPTDRHELRKFNVVDYEYASESGRYFLIAADYSSYSSKGTLVRFYFKNCINEYQFMELKLEEVRIETDSLNTKPYITFELGGYAQPCYDLKAVRYATIHCREEDFKPQININALR